MSSYSTDGYRTDGPTNTAGNEANVKEEWGQGENDGRDSNSAGSCDTDMKSQKRKGKRKGSKSSLTAERRLSAERRLQGAHLRRVKSNRLFEELRAILPDASKHPENATQTSILGEAISFISRMNASLKAPVASTKRTDWSSILEKTTQELWLVLVPTGRIVYASPYSEAILGRPGWPLSSTNLLELLHHTSRDDVQGLMNECVNADRCDPDSEGGRQRCTAHVLWSQDVRAVELVAQPVQSEQTGDTVYVLVRVLPLFPSPAEDGKLGETDGSMLLTKMDMAGTIVYSTGSCMDFLGVPKEVVYSLCSFDFVHPDDLPRLAEIHSRAAVALEANQLDVRLGPLCYRLFNKRTHTHGWVMSEWALERKLVGGMQQDRLVAWTWRAHPVPSHKKGTSTPPFNLACFQEFLLAQQENLQLKQHLREAIEAPECLPHSLPAKHHPPITVSGPPKPLSGPPSFTDSTRRPVEPLATRPQPSNVHGQNSVMPRPQNPVHDSSEIPGGPNHNHIFVAPKPDPETPRPMPEMKNNGRPPIPGGPPPGVNPLEEFYPLEYRNPKPPSGLPMPRDPPAPMSNGSQFYPGKHNESPYQYQNSVPKTPSGHHLPRPSPPPPSALGPSGPPNHQMHHQRSHSQASIPVPSPQIHHRYPPDTNHHANGRQPGAVVRGEYAPPREQVGYKEMPPYQYDHRDHRYDPYRRPALPARAPPPPANLPPENSMNPHPHAHSMASPPAHTRPENMGQMSREPSPRSVSGWEADSSRRYRAILHDRYPPAPGRHYNGMESDEMAMAPPHMSVKVQGNFVHVPGAGDSAGYQKSYIVGGFQPGEMDPRSTWQQYERDGFGHPPGT